MADDSIFDSLSGQQLDEYFLEALLGKGGMASVFRGVDTRLKRPAAIKVINRPLRGNPEYAARFEREAQAIAQLKHPHIVGIYRFGEVSGLPYIAMEYIDGPNLAMILAAYREKEELIPPPAARRIIRQVCQALDYAHSRGVVHRDIKPSNIMLNKEGDAVLTDFGLVLLNSETRGETLGTPQYVAPEQVISSAAAIPQSDLYALGVIMFEMFTATLPFDAAHPHDVTMMHLTEPPPSPRQLNPEISPELEIVLLRALAKEPENRYPTGVALADALDQALQDEPVDVAVAGSQPGSGPLLPDPIPTVSEAPASTTPDRERKAMISLYVLENIRTLLAALAEQLSREELDQLYADQATFQPVRDQLARSETRAEMVERMLEYAEQTVQVDELLAPIKERHPTIYEKYQPYYELIRTGRTDLVGRNLGKYHLVEWLGQGGMADIYKAYQSGLARFVAIKVIHSHLTDNIELIERFEREAMAVAGLHHPNIVQVFDFDREDDLFYMVMEFVDGPTLQAELAERRTTGRLFPLAEVVTIFNALAGAIDHAHSKGMVHRDLKPSNIMFTSSRRVVLTDFGIARVKSDPSYTRTRATVGTPAYMSPEQARGEGSDERSDVYSLGVMLYELVTGQIPFEVDNPVVILLHLESGSWPRPTEINPNLPAAIEQVILKAMSRDPADRFRTAGEMDEALQQAAREAGPVAPVTGQQSPPDASGANVATPTGVRPVKAKKERQNTALIKAKAAPPSPQIRLRVVTSGQEIVAVGQAELVVGRTFKQSVPDIDLGPYSSREAGISRQHCRLLHKEKQWFVEDLGSTNGTFVNKTRVVPDRPAALKNGDVIRCGQIELELKIT